MSLKFAGPFHGTYQQGTLTYLIVIIKKTAQMYLWIFKKCLKYCSVEGCKHH